MSLPIMFRELFRIHLTWRRRQPVTEKTFSQLFSNNRESFFRPLHDRCGTRWIGLAILRCWKKRKLFWKYAFICFRKLKLQRLFGSDFSEPITANWIILCRHMRWNPFWNHMPITGFCLVLYLEDDLVFISRRYYNKMCENINYDFLDKSKPIL